MPKPNPYELVRVKNDAGHEYTTRRAAAEASGVTVLDKPARDARGQVRPTVYHQPRQFDPGKHNVDKVLAHLEQASEAERDRVLAAEADGKDRTTITSWQPAGDEHTDTPSQEA